MYRVAHEGTGKLFALKVYEKQTITMKRRGPLGERDTYSNICQVRNANKDQERMATNEYLRYRKCQHQNIVKCYGFAIDQDGNWCLLLEYAAQGDLKQFYKQFTKHKKWGISTKEFSISKRLKFVH